MTAPEENVTSVKLGTATAGVAPRSAVAQVVAGAPPGPPGVCRRKAAKSAATRTTSSAAAATAPNVAHRFGRRWLPPLPRAAPRDAADDSGRPGRLVVRRPC